MSCPACGGSKFVTVKGAVERQGPNGPIRYDSSEPCKECSTLGSAIKTGPSASFKKANLREAARDWLRTHPIAAGLFLRFATELASRGRRFGISLITERIRWECAIEGWKAGDYKIQNSYRAYIARWLMEQPPFLNNPKLQKLITLRDVKW